MPTLAFWRTDSRHPSITAARRRVRALRWSPLVIERQLGLRIRLLAGEYHVEVGANDAHLLRVER